MRAINLSSIEKRLFLLLIGADFILIALHLANFLAFNHKYPMLSIHRDGGYPEMYQYAKFGFIAGTAFLISWKNKTWHFSAWGLFFLYMLLDDSMQIHERLGLLISAKLDFNLTSGVRLQDIGEFVVSVIAGSLLFIPLMFAYRGGTQTFKKSSHWIILLVLILAFFGVLIDATQYAIKKSYNIDLIMNVIEDGGEMFTASLIALYFVFITLRDNFGGSNLSDIELIFYS